MTEEQLPRCHKTQDLFDDQIKAGLIGELKEAINQLIKKKEEKSDEPAS